MRRATATQAAFSHKTLVVWVALLAVVLLRERLGPLHVLAIGLLMAGQVVLVSSLGVVTFGVGEAMILAATLLWAVEVIVVKRLVAPLEPRTLAAARMALGSTYDDHVQSGRRSPVDDVLAVTLHVPVLAMPPRH